MTPMFNPRGPEVYYPGMPCNPPTPSAVDYLKQEIEEIKSQLGDSTIPHVVVANMDALPAEGSEHVVYITTENNRVFRWTGEEYAVISDIVQTSDNFELIATHINTVKGNPHKVTKADVGLSNVDNTSDNDKPVSKKQLAVIELEAASRYAQYQSLQKDFNSKVNSLTDADITLGTRIDTEVTNRTKADTTLQTNIDTEVTTRAEADKTLQANIDAEASTRSEADNKLREDLAAHIADKSNPHAVTAEQVGAYTKAEVDEKIGEGGKVQSVNGKDGVVVLTADDVGALPATKDETTGEYKVAEAAVFKKKVTIELDETDEEESTESGSGIGIAAFDSTTERGVEIYDETANKSSALVPDGTPFVTMGTIKEAAYQFPTFSNDDTIKTIIAKLQQIISLLQGIGD